MTTILFYSKYSACCTKLLDILEQSDIDVKDVFDTNMICVDNKNVKNRIRSNKELGITKVPVILRIMDDGNVEKYEGAQAFQWVIEVVNSNTVVDDPIPKISSPEVVVDDEIVEPPKVKKQSAIKKSSRKKSSNKTYISDLPDDDGSDSSENNIVIETPQELRDHKPEKVKSISTDIMSVAQSIQKSREQIDSTNKPPSIEQRMKR